MRIIVAPFVGAWIEILITSDKTIKSPSLRSSERGLKSELANDSTDDVTSLRSSERGLK